MSYFDLKEAMAVKRGSWVTGQFLLLGWLFACGCAVKEVTPETPQKEPLRPYDLVNACAVVVSENEPKGSGFFVTHYGIGRPANYFVTARHIVEKLLPTFNQWPRLELRVKRQGGSEAATECIALQRNRNGTYWYQHTDANVDLAVIPVTNLQYMAQAGLDIRPLVYSSGATRDPDGRYMRQDYIIPDTPGFLSKSLRERHHIGPGADIFILGVSPELAKCETGTEFLLTVRKGVISAMPTGDINYLYGPTRLIVLDCPVVRGNSGGPVFAMVAEKRSDGSAGNTTPHLLGIVSSFLKDRVIYSLPSEKYPFVENSGLSLVTPVDYLAEILCGVGRDDAAP